jgi:sulfite reductase alpha subunit-like flavoprotein
MLSFFTNIPADTWTLLIGLVVFAALRYLVRRQVKSALNTPTTTHHSKSADTNHAKTTPKVVEEEKKSGKTACCQSSNAASCANSSKDDGQLVILYGTTTGTARKLSSQLAARLDEKCTVRDCADFGKNIDEEFAAYAKTRARLVSLT